AHHLDLISLPLFQLDREGLEKLLALVLLVNRFVDGALVLGLAVDEFQKVRFLYRPEQFIGSNEAVAIQVVLAEISPLSAALAPFGERDLTVLVRVERREPRRQTLHARQEAHGERAGAGPDAVQARCDDAMDSRPGGAMDDARSQAPPAGALLRDDSAGGIFQIKIGEKHPAHVLDLIGLAALQPDGEDLERL